MDLRSVERFLQAKHPRNDGFNINDLHVTASPREGM